jgi:hypothetical protein
MSEQPSNPDDRVEPEADETTTSSEGYGSLSVEDNPAGTVDPAELADTAKPDDAPVGYQPEASEADESSGSSR